MTAEVYRDDGPLAAVLIRLGRQPAPVASIVGGALVLVSTVRTDADAFGVVLLAGVAAFVILASLGHAGAESRTAWLVPALLRAAEYGFIVYLGWRLGGSAPAAAFALLGAVAFHQYDVDHRLRIRGSPPPRAVGYAGLGWDGRMLMLTVAAGLGAFTTVALILGAVILAVGVGENLIVWRHRPSTPASDATGGGLR